MHASSSTIILHSEKIRFFRLAIFRKKSLKTDLMHATYKNLQESDTSHILGIYKFWIFGVLEL